MGNNMGNNMGGGTMMPPAGGTGSYYPNPNNFIENSNEPSLIIKPFLYLGGMYARKNPRVLEYLGITHVLNMAAELHLDTVYLTNRNITVKHIPAEDYESYNIRQHFEEAFQFIEDCLMKNGRILVHCAVGVSRSPTIVIAYIMYRYGMSYQAAFQYVQSLRPVNPNNSFKMQLQEFDYELQSLNRQNGQQQQPQPQKPTLTTPPPTQTTAQQQYLANLMALQNRVGYMDNVNTNTNTSNFNMNGVNPISVKSGSKKNYTNHPDKIAAANYMDQSMLFPTAAGAALNNPYYVDPVTANVIRRQNSIRANQHPHHYLHHQQQYQPYSRSTTLTRQKFQRPRSMNNSNPFFNIADFHDFNRRTSKSIDNVLLRKSFEKTRSSINKLFTLLHMKLHGIPVY